MLGVVEKWVSPMRELKSLASGLLKKFLSIFSVIFDQNGIDAGIACVV